VLCGFSIFLIRLSTLFISPPFPRSEVSLPTFFSSCVRSLFPYFCCRSRPFFFTLCCHSFPLALSLHAARESVGLLFPQILSLSPPIFCRCHHVNFHVRVDHTVPPVFPLTFTRLPPRAVIRIQTALHFFALHAPLYLSPPSSYLFARSFSRFPSSFSSRSTAQDGHYRPIS